MRETVLNNVNESIIVSKLQNLYDSNADLFYSFMHDVIGLKSKGNTVFAHDSRCEDLTNKTSINVSHIFQRLYDVFIIDGKDKTNNTEYLRDCITFLTKQQNICPQIIICVSAEHFTDVNDTVNQILTNITRSKNEYFVKVIDVYYLLYQLEQYEHNMGV